MFYSKTDKNSDNPHKWIIEMTKKVSRKVKRLFSVLGMRINERDIDVWQKEDRKKKKVWLSFSKKNRGEKYTHKKWERKPERVWEWEEIIRIQGIYINFRANIRLNKII